MSVAACGDAARLDAILARYPHEEPSLIQVLQDVQRAYRYLPCDVLARVAAELSVPVSKVFSVATFYKAFALAPRGRTVVRVCTGTACHIRGAAQIAEEVVRALHVAPGETTPDGEFSIETVNCVGACAMAPVLIVGERYCGNAKAAGVEGYLAAGNGRDAD